MADPRRAPDFPSPDDNRRGIWLRCEDAPTVPADFAGQIVLLHFFSASSVHCAHQSQALAALQTRFAGRPFVLLGVHVTREPAEDNVEQLKVALDRLAISYPVFMDRELSVWTAYGCRALPTLCVIDASGEICFQGAGEADRDRLLVAVQSLLDGIDDDTAVVHSTTASPAIDLPLPGLDRLRYPSGLAVDDERSLLWIADTGNDRVLGCDLETGKVRHLVGSGLPGASGGSFDQARFSRPRGIAVREEGILVADSGNHLIRQFDVDCGEVTALVGQGRPVVDLYGGACWDDQGFASPWDLVLDDQHLYVAMAGLHQIWLADLYDGSAEAFAGQGISDQVDGTRHDAAFSQPEAMAVRGEVLGIVDRASGRLRCLDLQSDHVMTGAARFDGPRSIAATPEGWLVGDAAGIHPVSEDGETLGPPIHSVVADAIAVHGDRVFVADGAGHRIVCMDLDGGAVTPFELSFRDCELALSEADAWSLGSVSLLASAQVTLRLALLCPLDLQVPLDTPVRASVRQVAGAVLTTDRQVLAEVYGTVVLIHGVPTADLNPAEEGGQEGVLELVLQYALCSNEDAVWHPQTQRLRLRAVLRADGPDLSDAVMDSASKST